MATTLYHPTDLVTMVQGDKKRRFKNKQKGRQLGALSKIK